MGLINETAAWIVDTWNSFSRQSLWVRLSDVDDNTGGLPVDVQDQTTPPVDLFFIRSLAAPTTLAAAVTLNSYTIQLTGTTGFIAGIYIGIFDPTNKRFFFAEVLSLAGNVATLDTPIDFAFAAGTTVIPSTRNMNVDGSTTAREYVINGPGAGSGFRIDITRILIHITDESDMDDGKFGGIPALTKGLILRKEDGEVRNIFNVKSNGEFANLSFDFDYVSKAPAGTYGIRGRLSFAGQEKHGVAIRLGEGDSLKIIVQDDLSALSSFRIIGQGHIVED